MSGGRVLKFKEKTQNPAGRIKSMYGAFGSQHIILYSNSICPFLLTWGLRMQGKKKKHDYREW